MLENLTRREFLKGSAALSLGVAFGGSSLLFGAQNLINIPEVTLNNGVKIPQFGYGTWKVTGSDGQRAMLDAFNVGYRLIDSASAYRNESELGAAFKQSGLKREEVFITTKIAREMDATQAFNDSLARLQMDYIDLYLLHFSSNLNFARWEALEKLYAQGKVRALGVSNFGIEDIKALMDRFKIKPAVNQIELHPFYVEKDLIEFCKAENIAVEAYTPLGNIKRAMAEPILQSVAKKHNKSVAQIMLRWSVQNGFIAIPKTINKNRMQENLNIFDFSLDTEDLAQIATLSSKNMRGWF